MQSVIVGCGAYLPEKIITNADLAEKVNTTDEWIRQRTGITQRHVAAPGELTSDLAAAAGRRALADAGVTAADVDMIIVATATPDRTFPATAAQVQALLGADNAAAFDLQAVCSGFVYGLSVADSFIRSGAFRTVLLIGAETFSRILDWHDRSTCILFGDGAGAVVLQAQQDISDAPRGILATTIHADGRQRDLLCVDGGVSFNQQVGHIRMQGREVFRHAVVRLAEAVDTVLAKAGLPASAIDWLVPHQANTRIIASVAEKLAMPLEKVVITIAVHANTSAASIPLAFATARADGRIQQGDVVLFNAMGGGFTWGATIVRV